MLILTIVSLKVGTLHQKSNELNSSILAQRIYDHPDFQYKYLTTNDEQHRSLEFEKLVKDIIVEDRKKEIDFYKLFIQDEAFQLAFLNNLRQVIDKKSLTSSTR